MSNNDVVRKGHLEEIKKTLNGQLDTLNGLLATWGKNTNKRRVATELKEALELKFKTFLEQVTTYVDEKNLFETHQSETQSQLFQLEEEILKLEEEIFQLKQNLNCLAKVKHPQPVFVFDEKGYQNIMQPSTQFEVALKKKKAKAQELYQLKSAYLKQKQGLELLLEKNTTAFRDESYALINKARPILKEELNVFKRIVNWFLDILSRIFPIHTKKKPLHERQLDAVQNNLQHVTHCNIRNLKQVRNLSFFEAVQEELYCPCSVTPIAK